MTTLNANLLLTLLLLFYSVGYTTITHSQEPFATEQEAVNEPAIVEEKPVTRTATEPESESKSGKEARSDDQVIEAPQEVPQAEPTGVSAEPEKTEVQSESDKTREKNGKSDGQAPEEPKIRISKIKVKGAKAVPVIEIEQSIGTDFPSIRFWRKKPAFDEEVLNDDMVRIKRLYANNGYYDAGAAYELKYNKENTRVEITINITEGEPVVLQDVDIKYKGELAENIKKEIKEGIPLKVGKTFSPNGYQQSKGEISDILSNNGYPKAEIEGEALVNRKEKWARAKFVVTPGQIYKCGEIMVQGNKKVKSYIVEREAIFNEDDTYSLEKVNETQARIFQLGLFRSVVINPIYNDKDHIADLEIVVQERKHGSVKIGGGYGTEDKLRGQVVWTQRNFFGNGRRLEVSGKASFITQRIQTSVIQPYIIGRDSELTGSINFQRDDVPSFKGRSFLSALSLRKTFKEHYSAFGAANVQFSKIQDSATRTPEEQSRENFFLTYFNLGLERDTTDNILNPTKGTVVSTGLESSFTALGSDVNYLKGTIELRGYKKYRDMVFAKRITVGVIQPFGDTGTFDIPIFKRFFAGGSVSMRGFPFQKLGPLDENNDPLGGNSLLVGSFEVRFPIYRDFGGVAFFDYGNVYPREWSFPIDEIKYAPGLGLRYDTIIGPIRFDVGYALNPEPGIRRVQFFISIGQAF